MRASSQARPVDRAARLDRLGELRELLRRQRHGAVPVEAGADPGPACGDALLPSSPPSPPSPPLSPLPPLGRGSLAVISGEWSSGKTSLALARIAQVTRAGHRAALVDGTGWIFPPALALMEGDLEKILVLQPPAERAVWAAEQVLRSGLFALAVLLEPRRLDRPALRRLQLAAERGGSSCLLVPRDPTSPLPGLFSLRLCVRAIPQGGEAQAPIAAPPRRYQVQAVHQRGLAAPGLSAGARSSGA